MGVGRIFRKIAEIGLPVAAEVLEGTKTPDMPVREAYKLLDGSIQITEKVSKEFLNYQIQVNTLFDEKLDAVLADLEELKQV